MKPYSCALSALAILLLLSPVSHAEEEIALMFPKYEPKDRYPKIGRKDIIYVLKKDVHGNTEYTETGLKEFVGLFEKDDYGVAQIELWIDGRAESDKITRLFVSAGGNGGCRIILLPRRQY